MSIEQKEGINKEKKNILSSHFAYVISKLKDICLFPKEKESQDLTDEVEHVMRDHTEADEAARRHRAEQEQHHSSKLKEKIAAKKKVIIFYIFYFSLPQLALI